MRGLWIVIALSLLAGCQFWRGQMNTVERLSAEQLYWPCDTSLIQSWQLSSLDNEFAARFTVISECSDNSWRWVLLDSLGVQVASVHATADLTELSYGAPSTLKPWARHAYGAWLLAFMPDQRLPADFASGLKVSSRQGRRELYDSGILRAHVTYAVQGQRTMTVVTDLARFHIQVKPL